MNPVSRISASILLGLVALVMLFHGCILLKIIPYSITWGGRLQNDEQMYIFEVISILINAFLGWIVLMKSRMVLFSFPEVVVNAVLWAFLLLFLMNTFGNLFAKTSLEKCFALLTLIFAVLILLILKNKKEQVV